MDTGDTDTKTDDVLNEVDKLDAFDEFVDADGRCTWPVRVTALAVSTGAARKSKSVRKHLKMHDGCKLQLRRAHADAERSKRLLAACVRHMATNGLGLPSEFRATDRQLMYGGTEPCTEGVTCIGSAVDNKQSIALTMINLPTLCDRPTRFSQHEELKHIKFPNCIAYNKKNERMMPFVESKIAHMLEYEVVSTTTNRRLDNHDVVSREDEPRVITADLQFRVELCFYDSGERVTVADLAQDKIVIDQSVLQGGVFVDGKDPCNERYRLTDGRFKVGPLRIAALTQYTASTASGTHIRGYKYVATCTTPGFEWLQHSTFEFYACARQNRARFLHQLPESEGGVPRVPVEEKYTALLKAISTSTGRSLNGVRLDSVTDVTMWAQNAILTRHAERFE